MLTTIQVQSVDGTSMELPVVSELVNVNPFQIRKVEGLGPVKANINSTPFGAARGDIFVGSSISKRNIVITIGLNPNWVDQTMESLRGLLYEHFMTEQEVELQFLTTHLPDVHIFGYVEAFEPNIFSKDPEIQISIICPEPDFVAMDETVVTGLTDEALHDIVYSGTVSTGFLLVLTPTDVTDIGVFTLENTLAPFGLPESFQFSGTVDSTHTVSFSSKVGDKFIRSLSGGLYTNLMSTVSDDSIWLTLLRGTNQFRVLNAIPGVQWTISYNTRYGGI